VHFGVARGAQTVRLESQAVNRQAGETADVDGMLRSTSLVDDAWPADAVLQTHVDTAALAAHLRAQAIPAELSCDAGRYVCNALYFSTLAWLTVACPALPCVFVHVPPVGDDHVDPQGEPWTQVRLCGVVQTVIRWMLGRIGQA
jgi:pyroglutamyl-peptidase